MWRSYRGEPTGETLVWSWQDGRLETTVPSLDIHGILVICDTAGER